MAKSNKAPAADKAKAEAEKEEEAKLLAEKKAADKAKAEAKKVNFGTEIFFIEDPKFYEELDKKVTDKANKDDFSFWNAKKLPGFCPIRMRYEKWAIMTTSNRGDIKGNKGDFLIKDPNGNKLCVASDLFRAIYNKVVA